MDCDHTLSTTADQLIRQLMERGGENEKYELIPPSNESLTLFKV